jgi:hypothetical protein
MGSTGKIITAIIVVAVIVGGAFLLTNKKSDEKTTGDTSGSSSQNQDSDTSGSTDTGSNNNEQADVTITYDGSSFNLSDTVIKSGGTVKVVNDSDEELDFDSNPHPVHTDNPELNAGDIAPGDSKTFVLKTKGSWGFHNHLNSSQKGELTVE